MSAAATKAFGAKRGPGAKAPKPAITMRAALSDDRLLGLILGGESWAAWRVVLIAIMGESLTPGERFVFQALTGRDREPGELVEEFWGIIGRRGGKSRAMSALAVFLACFRDYGAVTVVGEKPTVLVMAQNVKQAGISLSYIVGALEGVPMLSGVIRNKTADSVELSNNVTIEVRPANFRGLRGVTAVAVLADEIAFWFDESSRVSKTRIQKS